MDDQIVSYARHHAASGWLNLPQADELAVRETIVEHFQGKPTSTVSQLETRLFDKFASLNLDWQLVAQTEAGECHLQGYIAAQKPGARVKRMEALQNSCDCCAKVHGLECEVVAPNALNKNWQTQVWVGKSRIHSSAADRPDGSWPSAGLQHPGCRGSWVIGRRPSLPHGISKEFADWMDSLLKSSRSPRNSGVCGKPIAQSCPSPLISAPWREPDCCARIRNPFRSATTNLHPISTMLTDVTLLLNSIPRINDISDFGVLQTVGN